MRALITISLIIDSYFVDEKFIYKAHDKNDKWKYDALL